MEGQSSYLKKLIPSLLMTWRHNYQLVAIIRSFSWSCIVAFVKWDRGNLTKTHKLCHSPGTIFINSCSISLKNPISRKTTWPAWRDHTIWWSLYAGFNIAPNTMRQHKFKTERRRVILHSRGAYSTAYMLFNNQNPHRTVKHWQRCWLKRVIKLISRMLF